MAAVNLDRGAAIPLWVQLKAVLRRRIESGELPADAMLPSEAVLCAQFGVSRTVVREALADLVAERLIYKIKGKGALVAARGVEEDFVGTTISFSMEMSLKGRNVTTRILGQEVAAAAQPEARHLRIPVGDPVVRITRLRAVDGQQRLLVTSVLPSRLVPGLERVKLENASLYETLRRRYGLRLVRAERWIEAIEATPAQATLLELGPHASLLSIDSVSSLADGTPAEFYSAVYLTRGSRLHILSGASGT